MRGLPALRVAQLPTARASRPALLRASNGAHALREVVRRSPRALAAGAPRTFLNLNGILGGGQKGDSYEETIVLPYSAEELYEIVADVNSYSQFVPYCVSSRVLGPTRRPDVRTQKERPTSVVDAELAIGFSAVQESYVSEVSMRPGEYVTARAKPSALFNSLSTTWRFQALPAAGTTPQTRVKFSLDFSFANQLYAALTRQMFQKLSANMIEAFTQRAARVYGRRRRVTTKA